MNFDSILTKHKKKFKKKLEGFFNSLHCSNKGEEELLSAMKYACISDNAKYIRSFIILEVFKMLKGRMNSSITNLAIAVELAHAYSLIHDDLPCMDNSDTRRGEPALHKKFPESTALMAGSALLTISFQILAKIGNLKIIDLFANTCGIYGILSGQVLDLNENLKRDNFEIMNYHKTGKLFEFCTTSAGILANCDSRKQAILKEYGQLIGIIFQMQDDILDEEEDKCSFLSFYTKPALIKEIEKNVYKAIKLMYPFKKGEILKSLPLFLSTRNF